MSIYTPPRSKRQSTICNDLGDCNLPSALALPSQQKLHFDARNHNMSHSVQNIALAYARSSKEASLRESSRHPKERQKARRFFVTALKTHPKQNLIRDFHDRRDDAAVAYGIKIGRES